MISELAPYDTGDLSELDSAVHVNLDSNTASTEQDETEVDIGAITHVIASDHNDVVSGNEQANIVDGGSGNDNINGSAPTSDATDHDTLSGGAGDDIIEGVLVLTL